MIFEWRSEKVIENALWIAEGRKFQREGPASEKALR